MDKLSDIAHVEELSIQYSGGGGDSAHNRCILNTNATASCTGKALLTVYLTAKDKYGNYITFNDPSIFDSIWLNYYHEEGQQTHLTFHEFLKPVNVTSAAAGTLYYSERYNPFGAHSKTEFTYEITGARAPYKNKVGCELKLPNGEVIYSRKASGSRFVEVESLDIGPDKKIFVHSAQDLQPAAAVGRIQCTAGNPYTIEFTATGGQNPYYYEIVGTTYESLPIAGRIELDKPKAQKSSVWIGARDKDGFGAQYSETETPESAVNGWRRYEIEVVSANINVSLNQTLPDKLVGDQYPVVEISAAGGKGPYRYWTDGDVPDGLHIVHGSAVFTGKPERAGNYSFKIWAEDSDNSQGNIDCHMAIAPRFGGEYDGDSNATVGQDYHGTIAENGGFPPLRYEMELPEGLKLEPFIIHGAGNHYRARIVGKPTKPVTNFPMNPYVIDSKGNRAKLLARPAELTVQPAPAVDLAIGALLRGHFTLVSGGTHEDLTISGQLAGGGLSETNLPLEKIVLKIKRPGDQNYVDVVKDKVKWHENDKGQHWFSDGLHFTLSGIAWTPGRSLPEYTMVADLNSHASEPRTVRFPLKEFVRNVGFRSGEDPLDDMVVKAGNTTLTLHMAFYNPLDDLTVKLVLPNGVKGQKLSATKNPASLQFSSSWDGHLQTVLFQIKKDVPLEIPSGKSLPLNIAIPISVDSSFRTGEVQVELDSASKLVERIVNNTEKNEAHLHITMET